MIKKRLVNTAIVIMTLITGDAFAQTNSGSNGIKTADVNFRELAEYYKEHPAPYKQKPPMDEDEEEEHRTPHAGPSSQVHMYHPSLNRRGGGTYHMPDLPVSPGPNDSFLSTGSPGSSIPPDTHGDIDSQYCVTAINTDIHIQTRVGGEVSIIGLDLFWETVLPSGTGTFDPRVHYDPYSKRWILVTDAVNNSTMGSSTLLIAVSATNDPTGTWHLYSYAVDPTGAAWLDYPNVGFNQKWVVITGNMFPNVTGGASGAVVYTFDYASLKSGTLVTPTKISQSSAFTICPARTMDPAEPNVFCVQSWSGNNGQLRLWKISGPVATPTMTSIGYPTTTQHWHGSGTTNFASQVGTTNKVDAGDDRVTSLVFKNKKLWTCHTVFLPSPGTASRASVQWWQFDTLANPIQIGYINDAATPTFFDYSSIAVNDSNDALIGFGYLNANLHPSAGYALHLHTDPIDSTRPPFIFRHGTSSYYTTFGGSRNRWGDYSATCLDPRNNMDFWTIQEVSNSSGTSANWETWWANVQICYKPQAPTLAYSGTPCAGDTTSFVINPIAGATSYVWYIAGTGWSGSGSGTTFHAIAGTSTATVVAVAYNSCGEGESLTFHITPTAPPESPAISVATAPCTGVTTAVFTASGSSGFSWTVVGTGWSGTSTSSTLNATVGTGTALIICVASNACGTSAPDTLVIAPGTPTATFTESVHSTVMGATVTVTPTITLPAGSLVTWNFSGGIATPGTGTGVQTVHWTTPGTKTVSVSVDNYGCSAMYTDTVHIKDPTGVANVNGAQQTISILPNPSDGMFDVVFANPISNTITITLTDMEGRVVYNKSFAPGSNRLSVKATALIPGNYALTILGSGEPETRLIAITK